MIFVEDNKPYRLLEADRACHFMRFRVSMYQIDICSIQRLFFFLNLFLSFALMAFNLLQIVNNVFWYVMIGAQ